MNISLIKKRFKEFIPNQYLPSSIAIEYIRRVQAQEKIAGGIFTGLSYPTESVCSQNIPKLLGMYELELVPFIRQLSDMDIRYIIGVGAAEGYYAMGCALLWPKAQIVAFETTEKGRLLIKEYASRNNVTSRISVNGHCTEENFLSVINHKDEGLLIMDIEGGEKDLLIQAHVNALRNYFLIVEIHDSIDPNLGDQIKLNFSQTHHIEEVWSRQRKSSDIRLPLSSITKLYINHCLLAYSYERPHPMRWFCMTPLSKLQSLANAR